MRPSIKAFEPAWWLQNPHAQTIIGRAMRQKSGVDFVRVQLDTPDGDVLGLDFAQVHGTETPAEDAPVVLALHGLEGSAQSGYMYETYRQAAARGLRAVGMNFRSCGGTLSRTGRLYHSGETGDLAHAAAWLQDRYPAAAIGAIGFSLGANMLLKYLGEPREQRAVRAAAVVSPPFDLASGSDQLAHGFNRYYGEMFLRKLQQKTEQYAPLAGDRVVLERVRTARTLREYDDAVVAPLFGFEDADDYYTQSSSGQFIPHIQVPTLILRALDDPFFATGDVPHEAIENNPCVAAVLSEKGGHVGFVEGWGQFWAEREGVRYLAEKLTGITVQRMGHAAQ